MKYSILLPFLFTGLLLSACDGEPQDPGVQDPEVVENDRPETQAWIEDAMREHYYWRAKISGTLNNYTAGPEDFFMSLLNEADGKTINGSHYYYSYIEKAADRTRGYIQENDTYGFEFTSVWLGEQQLIALVLYVLPGTPAAEVGLKRGDWIVRVDGKPMTTTDAIMALYGDVKKELTVYQWDDSKGFEYSRDVSLGAARAIQDYSPIYKKKIITASNGKRVGYLLYDRFQAGKEGNDKDTSYDDELRRISSEFSGVDECVLDLRYNNGGLLSSACLMCAIFGPKEVLSAKSLGRLEYAEGSDEFGVDRSFLASGKNLNLSRLYVLTSSTTASASEAVINLLDPFMEVIVIGEVTEGKNVGSQKFVSDDKVWEMHPITSKIFNSKGKSDYADGWTPDHELGDVFDHYSDGVRPIGGLVDLGDENERLLKAALYHIVNGKFPSSTDRTRATKGTAYKKGVSSLDRKATGAVIPD